MKYFIYLLFVSVAYVASAQTYTVETVPNTKLVNNSYVSNPDGILSPASVTSINQLLDSLEKKTSSQVALVVLNSIGEADVFDFAQQLFVHWGIGQASNNNGLLILFVSDQHTIRFHTGDGLEGVLPDVVCKRIQREFMVPAFKEGNYDKGMLDGITQVVQILENPEATAEITAPEEEVEERYIYIFFIMLLVPLSIIMFFVERSRDKFRVERGLLKIQIGKSRWWLLYGLLPLALLIAAFQLNWNFLLFMAIAYGIIILYFLERWMRMNSLAVPYVEAADAYTVDHFYKSQNGGWIAAAIFFPVPMIFFYFYYRANRNKFRDWPRKCKECGAAATKLDEQAEREHQEAGFQLEEKLGTMDYDLWKCTSCGAFEALAFIGDKTEYTNCPKCKFMTFHTGTSRTIKSATYTSSGQGERELNCLHCGFKKKEKFTISQLESSSSSDSSSSSSGSSWSGSSSSSGSWGGGSSSGGGASSSW
jgi:uncharacterized protein